MTERKKLKPDFTRLGGFSGLSHPPDEKLWERYRKRLSSVNLLPSETTIKESLLIELISIETMLKVIDEQQLRSVRPFYTPMHIAKDKEVLSKRAEFIRSQL